MLNYLYKNYTFIGKIHEKLIKIYKFVCKMYKLKNFKKKKKINFWKKKISNASTATPSGVGPNLMDNGT